MIEWQIIRFISWVVCNDFEVKPLHVTYSGTAFVNTHIDIIFMFY